MNWLLLLHLISTLCLATNYSDCQVKKSPKKLSHDCVAEPECKEKCNIENVPSCWLDEGGQECTTLTERECVLQEGEDCSTRTEEDCRQVLQTQCSTQYTDQCNTRLERQCQAGLSVSLMSPQWENKGLCSRR